MARRKQRLPPNVIRAGERYRGRIKRGGKQYVGPRVDTPELAYEWVVEQREREAIWSRPGGAPRLADAWRLVEETFDDLSEATASFYRWHYSTLLLSWDATVELHRLTPEAVTVYIGQRRQVVGNGTVLKELTVLRRLFNLARKAGLVKENPVEQIRMPKHRQAKFHAIPAERIASILEFLRGRSERGRAFADIVELLYSTGMRRAELERLHFDHDIDLEARELFIRGKTGNRSQWISDELAELIERMRERLGRRKTVGAAHMIAQRFKRWRPALEAAKLLAADEPFSPHVMRHSYATTMVAAGVPLADAQRLMGHSTPAQTARYYAGRDGASRDAIQAVRAALRSTRPDPGSANRESG